MTYEERLDTLLKRLTPEMESAIRDAVAARRLPRSTLATLPEASLEAVNAGQPLESLLTKSNAALGNFEAIVRLVGRPPLFIRDDKVELQPMPEFPPNISDQIKCVERWIPSVGRIEFRNHQMAWGGTGWVVEHRGKGALVVTNRHVAQVVARRKADGTAVFMRSPSGVRYGAAIDFREEAGSLTGSNSHTAELIRIEYLADDSSADVALLYLEQDDFTLPTAFALMDDNEQVATDDLVALIGYPAYDSRNDASAQARYFQDLYEVKRFSPGKILQPPSANQLLTYDCTSLGGNSGSPLIRLSDGKVVGLHFQGSYLTANSAVPAKTINALLKGERPVSVSLQTKLDEAKDGSHAAGYFKDRQGFNCKFLESTEDNQVVSTPWPGIRADLARDIAAPSDKPNEPNELRYTHFGVKYSAKLKLPLITAVNIDGQSTVRIKRSADRWFADGRIPTEIQLNELNFKDSEIDRGHMVRREDPNWGTPLEAEQANFDTFHYVNAAAQHSRLNQGKQLWQGLENYILDSARTDGFKACVFTGPILRDADDEDSEIVIDGALAPLEFWKLVATLDADGKALHSTAYVLSQGQLLRKLLEKRSRHEALEGVVLGPYRTFQVAITDLAEATGYDFSAYFESDPLTNKDAGKEAQELGEPIVLPLSELEDIVL